MSNRNLTVRTAPELRSVLEEMAEDRGEVLADVVRDLLVVGVARTRPGVLQQHSPVLHLGVAQRATRRAVEALRRIEDDHLAVGVQEVMKGLSEASDSLDQMAVAFQEARE